ncbi:MAG: ribonuclease HII [Treponema sp.]|nr:ribonuclease HII [Treponema sp.]
MALKNKLIESHAFTGRGRRFLVGVDEAGRGPLAGPVYAAAVILPSDFPLQVLNDSKKLTEKKRDTAAFLIQENAAFGIASVEASEIDRINILQASLLAMTRAWEALVTAFPNIGQNNELCAVVDGLYCPALPIPCKALVKADSSVTEVMAASILAKTARDKMMKRFSWFYPEYGYEKHKGYPTKAHLEAIAKYGPSPIQRKSFKVKTIQGELW